MVKKPKGQGDKMNKETDRLLIENILLCDLEIWVLKHAEIDRHEIDKVMDIIRQFKDSRKLKGTK